MLPPEKGTQRTIKGRAEWVDTFDDPSVQRSVDLDLHLVAVCDQEIQQIERFVEGIAKKFNQRDLALLHTIHGIGRVLH